MSETALNHDTGRKTLVKLKLKYSRNFMRCAAELSLGGGAAPARVVVVNKLLLVFK